MNIMCSLYSKHNNRVLKGKMFSDMLQCGSVVMSSRDFKKVSY